MGDRGACGLHEADLVVVQVDAVREERALVERARAVEPRGDAEPAAGLGVAFVGRVFGSMDVEPDAVVARGLGACGEGVIRECERGVRPDHPPRER